MLLLFSSHLPIGPQPYPVLYGVANPVRGLLDRKRSEEHLPSSNQSKRKTQTNKNDNEKGTRIAKYTCQKKIDDGHSMERVWHSASREPSDTLPGSQPSTQTRSVYPIPMMHLNVLTFFLLTGGCSEGLDAFRFFFYTTRTHQPGSHRKATHDKNCDDVTVRGANPTLYARKKLSGLFAKFPKVQVEKKRGRIPAQDAEHQNYLILDHYYIYFWRTCPCAQGRVGS